MFPIHVAATGTVTAATACHLLSLILPLSLFPFCSLPVGCYWPTDRSSNQRILVSPNACFPGDAGSVDSSVVTRGPPLPERLLTDGSGRWLCSSGAVRPHYDGGTMFAVLPSRVLSLSLWFLLFSLQDLTAAVVVMSEHSVLPPHQLQLLLAIEKLLLLPNRQERWTKKELVASDGDDSYRSKMGWRVTN